MQVGEFRSVKDVVREVVQSFRKPYSMDWFLYFLLTTLYLFVAIVLVWGVALLCTNPTVQIVYVHGIVFLVFLELLPQQPDNNNRRR